MKFKQLRKRAEWVAKKNHISADEVEFEVLLDPCKEDTSVSYFGEILELMEMRGANIMILCDGKRNQK